MWSPTGSILSPTDLHLNIYNMTLQSERQPINIINIVPKRKNSLPVPIHSARMTCPHKLHSILAKQSVKRSHWNSLSSQI